MSERIYVHQICTRGHGSEDFRGLELQVIGSHELADLGVRN